MFGKYDIVNQLIFSVLLLFTLLTCVFVRFFKQSYQS